MIWRTSAIFHDERAIINNKDGHLYTLAHVIQQRPGSLYMAQNPPLYISIHTGASGVFQSSALNQNFFTTALGRDAFQQSRAQKA